MDATPKVKPIQRLSVRDPQRIAAYFDDGAPHPLIVIDAATDWPARRKWNLDFFASEYGSSVGVAPLNFGERPIVGKATLLRAFIEHLDAGYDRLPGVWVGSNDNAPDVDDALGWSFAWQPFRNDPRLLDDIRHFPAAIPNFTAAVCLDTYQALEQIHGHMLFAIYISRRNTITPLHRDWHHTFGCLVQFQGRKRVICLAPDVRPQMEEKSFDPENPDFSLFPEMRGRTLHSDELAPGEMLIIPPDWLHYTRAMDHSITLSHNFVNAVNFDAYRACLLADIEGSSAPAGVRDQALEFACLPNADRRKAGN